MRICIPTADDHGLDSTIHDHFGSAPCYAVVDTETGAIEMVHNVTGPYGPGDGHRHGHCHGHGRGQGRGRGRGQGSRADCSPIEHVDVESTDAIVCQSMGKRAFASFRRGGLEVWLTSAGTVRQAVDEARAGKLRKLTGSTACGGRGHRERHRNQTMPVDGDNT